MGRRRPPSEPKQPGSGARAKRPPAAATRPHERTTVGKRGPAVVCHARAPLPRPGSSGEPGTALCATHRVPEGRSGTMPDPAPRGTLLSLRPGAASAAVAAAAAAPDRLEACRYTGAVLDCVATAILAVVGDVPERGTLPLTLSLSLPLSRPPAANPVR